MNEGLKADFMKRLTLRNSPNIHLPPVKPVKKTEMGLLHGELNLLVKNLGLEAEDATPAKGKGKGGDDELFAFSPPKGKEDGSEFYSTQDNYNSRSSEQPLKKTGNYSGQVIELLNAKNPIQRSKLRAELDRQQEF